MLAFGSLLILVFMQIKNECFMVISFCEVTD